MSKKDLTTNIKEIKITIRGYCKNLLLQRVGKYRRNGWILDSYKLARKDQNLTTLGKWEDWNINKQTNLQKNKQK